jgi:PAS domain S-box-containing protein
VPIIVTSAFGDSDLLLRAIDIGVDGYILKPINLDDLKRLLAREASHLLQRKEIERLNALVREREEFLAVTLQSIGDAVIATDTKGRVVLMNRVASKLTGWPQDEAEGRRLTEVFHIINEKTRKVCENPVDKVLRTGMVVGLANHTALISRDGVERIIADSGAPIYGSDGKVIGVVLVFRDITEKSKMEEELFKVQKMESLGIFAGGIAHDFNNLLTAIMGSLSIALLHLTPENKAYQVLIEAEQVCERAKDLAQQLLTFSKGGMPMRKTVSIKDLIEGSVSFVTSGSNVKCVISIPEDLWPVGVDEGQMSQVIQNLIVNAEQSMPAGGVIRVTASNTSIRKGDNIPLEPGNYVKISIEDEGVGIPGEFIDRIFDPYFTTKQKGSGLGLAVVHTIVRNHDGYITVESERGAGSIFHIYLPASPGKEIRDRRSERREETVISGRGRILLMDDEEMVRKVASEMLRVLGYEVEAVSDGAEAVDMYSEAIRSGNPFDVVIMDLTIPGGMGGKEAIKKLLEIDPGVKAVVSSGYSEDPVMSDYRKYGFSEVIRKPYKLKEIGKILGNLFNG